MQEQVGTPIHSGQSAVFGDVGAPAVLLSAVEHRLRADGLRGVLALLNDRTRFRFTGLYRVAPPQLHNVSLHDRENPTLDVSGAVSTLSDTYCVIAWVREEGFVIADAPSDPKLAGHPWRDSVQSYAGVPVRGAGGCALGTLCHFDGRPRMLPPGELSVLRALAPLFAPWLAGDR